MVLLTSKYGLISSKVLVRATSSTKGVIAITRSIMASLRENMSIAVADIRKGKSIMFYRVNCVVSVQLSLSMAFCRNVQTI